MHSTRPTALILAFVASCLAAQQPAPPNSQPAQLESYGRVTGHIVCSDTGKPARFAGVQLVSERSAQTPMIDSTSLGTSLGYGKSSRGDTKDGPDFGALMTTGLSALMKGSNLSGMTTLDGSFSLEKVPAGTCYVVPQLAGYLSPISQFSQMERMKASPETLKAIESSAQKIVVGPNQAVNIDLQLELGASIGGVVRYDDGSPAAGVSPILMALGSDGKWKDIPPSTPMPSVTDEHGRYHFAGILAGNYAIKAALPTTQVLMGIGAGAISMQMHLGDALEIFSGGVLWQRDLKPIKLAAGEESNDADLVFPINGLHIVSGTVVAKADGHAVNSGTIQLQDPDDKSMLRTTMIGKDGIFQFNYVPDGAYLIIVSGAADLEGNTADDANPIALLLNAKNIKQLKEYGGASQPLTLPGNSEDLVLRVPDHAMKAPKGI